MSFPIEASDDSQKTVKRMEELLAVFDGLTSDSFTYWGLEKLSGEFLKILGADSLCVFFPDKEYGALRSEIAVGAFASSLKKRLIKYDEGIVGAVFSRGKPLFAPGENGNGGPVLPMEENLPSDIPAARVLAAPIIFDTALAGVIELVYSSSSREFSSEDKTPLNVFGSILNVLRMQGKLKEVIEAQSRGLDRKENEFYATTRVLRAISSILDMGALQEVMGEMLQEILSCEFSCVFSRTPEGRFFEVTGARFYDEENPSLSKARVRTGDSIEEWVDKVSRDYAIIGDFDHPSLWSAFPGIRDVVKTHGIDIIVPLIFNKRLVALIGLGKKYTGSAYQEKDLDFLKTFMPICAAAIVNAERFRDATRDPVTRLYAPYYFKERIAQETRRIAVCGRPAGLIMMDIDFFRRINETKGVTVGDEVIRQMAALMSSKMREGIDIPAYMGDEEFAALLPETAKEEAVARAEALRKNIENYPFYNGEIRLTVSGGVASYPEDAQDVDAFLREARGRLGRAKRTGRNRIVS